MLKRLKSISKKEDKIITEETIGMKKRNSWKGTKILTLNFRQ